MEDKTMLRTWQIAGIVVAVVVVLGLAFGGLVLAQGPMGGWGSGGMMGGWNGGPWSGGYSGNATPLTLD
jgi:hypothetical protein